MSWQPILSGELRERTLQAIREIAESISNGQEDLSASLASGHAGIALFFHHARETLDHPRTEERIDEHLDLAMEAAPRLNNLGLFTGLSGVAWCLQTLRQAEPASTTKIDALIEEITRDGWSAPYDLIYGLAGLGIYVLHHPNQAWSVRVWQQILQCFEALREQDPHSQGAWWTPSEMLHGSLARRFPKGHYNLGMAHGQAGVIAVLASRMNSSCKARAHAMLSSAVDWLLALEDRKPESSAFPPYVAPVSIDSPTSARSGWCYGDPGIAIALFRAGQALQRPELQAQAIALAKRDALRSSSSSRVVDAPLCHGAAGLGHIYNRLYQSTQDPDLARIARRWFRVALDLKRPTPTAGLFPSWWPGEQRWQASPGILDGMAGIGLALTAAISSRTPAWDAPLLLDLKSEECLPVTSIGGRMRRVYRAPLNTNI